jgi:two-component system nitrogen regulation response regulator GlnG
MGIQRLLLVDDEESILFALSRYFRGLRYRVDCARELEEAQALVTHTPYECIISDIRLSRSHGGEGFELTRFVRRSCAATRVILLTAYASNELETAALERGADAVLSKPIDLAALAEHIGRLVPGPFGTSDPCAAGSSC